VEDLELLSLSLKLRWDQDTNVNIYLIVVEEYFSEANSKYREYIICLLIVERFLYIVVENLQYLKQLLTDIDAIADLRQKMRFN
jgi:hypothetical protein